MRTEPCASVPGGARTPEELETLFEDALVVRDRSALAGLFEDGAVLAMGNGQAARGGEEIARCALATWEGERVYVADPRCVVQARDIALVVTDQGTNVVQRGRDGTWRIAIVHVLLDDGVGKASEKEWWRT